MAITVTSMGPNSTNIAFTDGELADDIVSFIDTFILSHGWVVHDSDAGAGNKCYKAPNVDGVSYKYALLTWTSTYIAIFPYEFWDATTHIGYNKATKFLAGNTYQPLTTSSGGNLYIFASARYFAILGRTNIGLFGGLVSTLGSGMGAQGVFEVERSKVGDDLPVPGTGVIAIGTASNPTSGTFGGSVSWYYNVPLTGGTGTGAKADIQVQGGNTPTVLNCFIVNPGTGYTVGNQLTWDKTLTGGGTAVGHKVVVNAIDMGLPPFIWVDTTLIGSLTANWTDYEGTNNKWGGSIGFCRTKGGRVGSLAQFSTGILCPFGFWGTHGLSNTAVNTTANAAVPLANFNYSSTYILPTLGTRIPSAYAVDLIAVGDTFNKSTWDVRGRIYGLKAITPGYGITLDTLTCNVDSDGWIDPAGSTSLHYISNGTNSTTLIRFVIPA